MCEMSDMILYGLETETTHPEGLFDDLSFLDCWENEKKVTRNLFMFCGLKNVKISKKRDFEQKSCWDIFQTIADIDIIFFWSRNTSHELTLNPSSDV